MTSDQMLDLAKRIKKAKGVSLAEQDKVPGPLWFMPLGDKDQRVIVEALQAAAALRSLAELPPKRT